MYVENHGLFPRTLLLRQLISIVSYTNSDYRITVHNIGGTQIHKLNVTCQGIIGSERARGRPCVNRQETYISATYHPASPRRRGLSRRSQWQCCLTTKVTLTLVAPLVETARLTDSCFCPSRAFLCKIERFSWRVSLESINVLKLFRVTDSRVFLLRKKPKPNTTSLLCHWPKIQTAHQRELHHNPWWEICRLSWVLESCYFHEKLMSRYREMFWRPGHAGDQRDCLTWT